MTRREELDRIIKERRYIKGGTKEACIKIREVLNHKMNPGNQLHAPGSCVDINEFIDAVETLFAFANDYPDTIVNQYYCENDCAYICRNSCPGQIYEIINKNAKQLCPYYVVEDK